MRGPNETGDTRNHPPALAPWHREVARSIIWWRCRFPGLPIYLIKQDVDSAFKIGSWLHVPDMGRNATDLPEPPAGKVPEDAKEAEWAAAEVEAGREPVLRVNPSRPHRLVPGAPAGDKDDYCPISFVPLFGGPGAPVAAVPAARHLRRDRPRVPAIRGPPRAHPRKRTVDNGWDTLSRP